MTDTEQLQQPDIQEAEDNNIKLIYEHVEYQIALVNRSIDISSAKLGFTLGLTTGLIIFQTTTHPINNHFLFFECVGSESVFNLSWFLPCWVSIKIWRSINACKSLVR